MGPRKCEQNQTCLGQDPLLLLLLLFVVVIVAVVAVVGAGVVVVVVVVRLVSWGLGVVCD